MFFCTSIYFHATVSLCCLNDNLYPNAFQIQVSHICSLRDHHALSLNEPYIVFVLSENLHV